MAAIARRPSPNPAVKGSFRADAAKGKENTKIWESLLKSVSSERKLAEKQLLVLGGNPEAQREFLESLSTESINARRQDKQRKPPIANQFALGYTYQDVLDTDQEDILARLSIYTLGEPSAAYSPLLKPLLTSKTIPNTLVVILLDWSQPWNWIRQLRDWVRLLRAVVASLSDECKHALQDNIDEWQKRKNFTQSENPNNATEDDVQLPAGPGVWDEPLGIPLCVVAQNANGIERLEKEQGWRRETFDFILQFLRTILAKHGASLIYTMPTAPGSLQALIHASLDIQGALQKKQLKHDVTSPDHILIPPNWDSWGKIRVQTTEMFDVENVSQIWSLDIQQPPTSSESVPELAIRQSTPTGSRPGSTAPRSDAAESPSVVLFAQQVKDPKANMHLPGTTPKSKDGIEVSTEDIQSFLAEQANLLKKYKVEDEKTKMISDVKKPGSGYVPATTTGDERKDIEEHIGPVQFNMGGIQVDVENTLKGLNDREDNRAAAIERPTTPTPRERKAEPISVDDNEKMMDFFKSLKTRGGSAANSPQPRRGAGMLD